jgi:hypothetical protein
MPSQCRSGTNRSFSTFPKQSSIVPVTDEGDGNDEPPPANQHPRAEAYSSRSTDASDPSRPCKATRTFFPLLDQPAAEDTMNMRQEPQNVSKQADVSGNGHLEGIQEQAQDPVQIVEPQPAIRAQTAARAETIEQSQLAPRAFSADVIQGRFHTPRAATAESAFSQSSRQGFFHGPILEPGSSEAMLETFRSYMVLGHSHLDVADQSQSVLPSPGRPPTRLSHERHSDAMNDFLEGLDGQALQAFIERYRHRSFEVVQAVVNHPVAPGTTTLPAAPTPDPEPTHHSRFWGLLTSCRCFRQIG